MSNVQTPENKALLLVNDFRKAFDEQNNIPIQSVVASDEERARFAVWRQHLGSVLTWYKQFAKNKDYSSAINAAMALGKMASVPKPAVVVSEADLLGFDNLCEHMWNELRKTTMRPYEEPAAPVEKEVRRPDCNFGRDSGCFVE